MGLLYLYWRVPKQHSKREMKENWKLLSRKEQISANVLSTVA
jgi:hypothetical protein